MRFKNLLINFYHDKFDYFFTVKMESGGVFPVVKSICQFSFAYSYNNTYDSYTVSDLKFLALTKGPPTRDLLKLDYNTMVQIYNNNRHTLNDSAQLYSAEKQNTVINTILLTQNQLLVDEMPLYKNSIKNQRAMRNYAASLYKQNHDRMREIRTRAAGNSRYDTALSVLALDKEQIQQKITVRDNTIKNLESVQQWERFNRQAAVGQINKYLTSIDTVLGTAIKDMAVGKIYLDAQQQWLERRKQALLSSEEIVERFPPVVIIPGDQVEYLMNYEVLSQELITQGLKELQKID